MSFDTDVFRWGATEWGTKRYAKVWVVRAVLLFWGVMVFVVLCVVLIYEKLLSGDSGVPGESDSKEILVKMVVWNFRDQ